MISTNSTLHTSANPTLRLHFRDMVNDLTREHEHREPYLGENGLELADGRFQTTSSWSDHHTSRVPALVLQLLGASPSGGGGDQMGTTYKSRPALRVEALDTVELIDDEASRWVKRLGHDDPGDSYEIVRAYRTIAGPAHPACGHRTCAAIRRGPGVERRRVKGSGTIACIRKLGGLHPSVSHCSKHKGEQDKTTKRWCCLRHELERDVRHWWHQARIITGWDVPAFKPHNSCPICGVRDSLRVRPDAALCVECRSLWEGADQIGVLARHIHEENDDDL